jgi:glycerol uptake facilitator-like aquaporin
MAHTKHSTKFLTTLLLIFIGVGVASLVFMAIASRAWQELSKRPRLPAAEWLLPWNT